METERKDERTTRIFFFKLIVGAVVFATVLFAVESMVHEESLLGGWNMQTLGAWRIDSLFPTLSQQPSLSKVDQDCIKPDNTTTNSSYPSPASPAPERDASVNPSPEAVLLYQQWDYLYIDQANTTLPESERNLSMEDVGLEKKIPHAPHLQNCPALVELRAEREKMLPGGKYPEWLDMNGDKPGKFPKPPWMKGNDDENVAFFRTVQRDIWLRQHPKNCRDPKVKFGLIDWVGEEHSGLGSQLHVMATNMGKVWTSGRVLVSTAWKRGMHEGCQGKDYGRVECYFADMASEECLQIALEELERDPGMPYLQYANITSDVRFVRFGGYEGPDVPDSLFQLWGGAEKWVSGIETTEMGGRISSLERPKVYRKWWHAQLTAYLYRMPTERLCRITNRARHDVYGMEVAMNVVAAQQQRALLNVGQPLFTADVWGKPAVSLEDEVWLEEEPYIPRPLLSMHIRQGDKAVEMQLFQLKDIMWSAERIRLHVPDLKHVWLSTEMKTVLDESKEYTPRWNFMYTQAHRVTGNMWNRDYEIESGVKQYIEHSLANLMIASEADFYVGTLGSNWNRLIDEFRKTRGRLRRGYIAVNDDEY